MKKLAEHIRQANKDVEDVQISSRKITNNLPKLSAWNWISPSRCRTLTRNRLPRKTLV